MLQPGTFVSERYEIIGVLGSGGMADVYKAKCHRLNRFVAIKVLKPEYSEDDNFVKKFRGEAQSVAGLSHPNIVNVYDVGDDGGLHYIVMELVEGITLKQFIEKKGRLEIRETVGIAIQIAQGIEAAHKNQIIHRDIKPQNIIISKEGKAMITDFGIAKATTSNTITSNAMGSVHYLSPEQARGGYSDEKSDIYSLGVTIYEMLSGRVPFAGDNTVSVALLHIQGEADSLHGLDPTIPMSLDKIVRKAMEKKPESRYHSATELIVDLKKALLEPTGAFVHIPEMVTDSPTINISENLSEIKNGTLFNMDDTGENSEKDENELDEDYDDLDAVDTKIEKIILISSIVGVAVIVILIIFLIGWFFEFWGTGKNKNPDIGFGIEDDNGLDDDEITFIVPAVVGYTEDEARNTIKLRAPNVELKFKEAYSDVIPKDQVMEQYPVADTEWSKDGEVLLTISLGAEPMRLPSLDGLTEANADKKLEELGLKVNHEYAASDLVEEGYVMHTAPEFGAMVVTGDTITLYISSGPSITPVEVPTLVGLTEARATEALTNLGLEKGRVTSEYSTAYPEGQVTYQSNVAGQTVAPGTKVDITISRGPEPTPTPTPIPTPEPTPKPTESPKKYKYYGDVIINVNPFDYIDDDTAEIVLEMEQDGYVTQIFDKTIDGGKFPLKIERVQGDSTKDGTVRMYVDNKLFKMPDESDAKTWRIKFRAVEE